MNISIFWFRRDLRLHDNIALYYSLKEHCIILPIFIFDTNILNELPEEDKRVNLIYDSILNLKNKLEKHNSSLLVLYGNPIDIHIKLLDIISVKHLFFNEDYEPYAIERDKQISDLYKYKNIIVHKYCDHVIFKPDHILKEDKTTYHVYSQYKKQWLKRFVEFQENKNYNIEQHYSHFISKNMIQENQSLWREFFRKIQNVYEDIDSIEKGIFPVPLLEKMNFKKTEYFLKPLNLHPESLKTYHLTRDLPSQERGTTNASVYLRFGLESVRHIASIAKQMNQKLLEELIWREFYIMILFHYPSSIYEEWNPKYSFMKHFWRNPLLDSKAEEDYEKWKEGKTGYYIIDAGMRELNETGYMHNRVRLNCASFLVKDLHIDWRFGERYFALKLMDFELASNVGNWQWVAGTGVDAAPYFRIFNPILQQKKFDPNLEYTKKWIKELNTLDYPQPMIQHEESKNKILDYIKSHL